MMAHKMGGQGYPSALLSLEGELRCGICLDLFEKPVILPCGHNFCKNCVANIIDQGPDTLTFSFVSIGPPNSFNCPICQQSINRRKHSLDVLPVNNVLESIVFLYKTHSPTDIFDHAWNKDIRGDFSKCIEHNLPQERYCDSCSIPVCKQCETKDHHGEKVRHKVDNALEIAIEHQSQIAGLLAEVKKKDIQLNGRIELLEDLISGIETNEEKVTKKLDDRISDIMSALRQQREELKRHLTNDVNEIRVPCTEELKKCKAVKTNIQEMTKKLRDIQRTKNIGLKIKLMKDSRRHLDKLLCYEIPWCVENQEVPKVTMPSWELSTMSVLKEIERLSWKHHETEKKESQSELTQTGQDNLNGSTPQVSVTPDLSSDKGQDVKGAVCGAEVTLNGSHVEEKTFDEPDGDIPLKFERAHTSSVNGTMPKIVVTPDHINAKANGNSSLLNPESSSLPGTDIDNSGTHPKTDLVVLPDVDVSGVRVISPLVGNDAGDQSMAKADLGSSEVAEKFKRRGERKTVTPGSPAQKFESERRKDKTKKEKSSKKTSRELFTGTETSPTTTSQALASFVARRRTISPASSVSRNLDSWSDSKDDSKGRRKEEAMRTSESDTKLLLYDEGPTLIGNEQLPKGTKQMKPVTESSKVRKSCPVNSLSSSNTSLQSSGSNTEHKSEGKKQSPKSFSKQPIAVSLDFGTDTEDVTKPPAEDQKMAKTRAKSLETVI